MIVESRARLPGLRQRLVISVADLVIHHLRDAGVGFLFGVPGGGSNLDLIEAAGRAGLPFVLTATETAGAIAAIAQAELSGRPGACVTTLGPGVASIVNGVACASLERAPLLVFTDSYPAAASRIVEHQRIDHAALLAPVTKWSATLSADNVDEVMRQALDRATTYPRGPVHIDCPGDVTSVEWRPPRGAAAASVAATLAGGAEVEPSLTDPVSLSPLVSRARRPLVIVGLGARRPLDAAAIRQLCASRGVPAMVTYKAKGVVADGDPHFAGVFTNGAIEQSIVAEADLLIGVGLDPVELIPRPWNFAPTVVGVGPWAMPSRHVPFAAQLITDVPSGMQWVGELLRTSEWDLKAIQRTVAAQRQRHLPRHRSPLRASRRADRREGGRRPFARDGRRRRPYVPRDDAVAGERAERHAHLERPLDDGVRAAGGDWRRAERPWRSARLDSRSRRSGHRADR